MTDKEQQIYQEIKDRWLGAVAVEAAKATVARVEAEFLRDRNHAKVEQAELRLKEEGERAAKIDDPFAKEAFTGLGSYMGPDLTHAAVALSSVREESNASVDAYDKCVLAEEAAMAALLQEFTLGLE